MSKITQQKVISFIVYHNMAFQSEKNMDGINPLTECIHSINDHGSQ